MCEYCHLSRGFKQWARLNTCTCDCATRHSVLKGKNAAKRKAGKVCHGCGHLLPSLIWCRFCGATLAYVMGHGLAGLMPVEIFDPAEAGCTHWLLVTDEVLSHVFYAPACSGHILEMRDAKGYRAVVPIWRLRGEEAAAP